MRLHDRAGPGRRRRQRLGGPHPPPPGRLRPGGDRDRRERHGDPSDPLRLRRWAGEGPLVVDDHTRLDFSVPRSRDSSYGIANYTTDNWLVDRLEPGATHDVAFATFVRKVRELASHKRPVLSHLRGVEDTGLTRAEAERRVQDALEKLPVH